MKKALSASGIAVREAMSEHRLLNPGENCWRVETARRFAFVVDGADYFISLRKALLQARHAITLVGWDFDTRISFGNSDDGGPERLGTSYSGLRTGHPRSKSGCCAGTRALSRPCCAAIRFSPSCAGRRIHVSR